MHLFYAHLCSVAESYSLFGHGAQCPNAEFLQALGPAPEQWSLGDPQSLQRILSAASPVAPGPRPVLVSDIPHATLQSRAAVKQTAACAASAAGPPMVVKASAEGPPVVVEAKQTEKLAEQEFRRYPLPIRKETAKGAKEEPARRRQQGNHKGKLTASKAEGRKRRREGKGGT